MAQKAHSHFKIFIITVTVIFLFNSCGDKTNEEVSIHSIFTIDTEFIPNDTIHANTGNLKLDNGNYYLDSTLYSGFIRSDYETGNIKSVAPYLNGKLFGASVTYYPDGKIRDVRNYKDNKSNGRHYGYWENGNAKFDFIYLNDKREGINKQWYKSGQPYAFLNFKNDEEDGLQQAWRVNGKLYINYEVKDDIRYGLQKSGLCYTLIDENIITK